MIWDRRTKNAALKFHCIEVQEGPLALLWERGCGCSMSRELRRNDSRERVARMTEVSNCLALKEIALDRPTSEGFDSTYSPLD